MSSAAAAAGKSVPAVAKSVDTSSVVQPSNGDFDQVAWAQNIQKKYNEERDKRIRSEGNSQYVDLTAADKSKHYQVDPWVDPNALETGKAVLTGGSHYKYLIIGAGFGGLLSAVRLIQAGIPVEEIQIVDSAGGFGGTWYWNRYPGIMCDIESYIYMPLLEELEYMPADKYASGNEMRQHAENIADKFNLKEKVFFGAKVVQMTWDQNQNEWEVELTQNEESVRMGAQFVLLTAGILNQPKLPGLPGIENFEGHTFHTSRWDYTYTGGSPEDPTLSNLKGKTVGIIGTGQVFPESDFPYSSSTDAEFLLSATAVQVVPQLAKWAKELYVFQRTPSAVNRRDNRPTDADWWKTEVASKKGWQRERSDNFNAHISHIAPDGVIDLVNDAWSNIPTYNALVGAPHNVTMDTVPAYVGGLYARDLPHQEAVRSRVDHVIKDKATAEKLKPWYPTWCKRPCFHDEYPPTFNSPNVKLIDTDGKGVECLTNKAVVTGGQEYEVDLLIFSTGFASPSAGTPAGRAGISITGRKGQTMEEKWTNGVGTLHGVISNGFPNLLMPGPSQMGAAANYTYILDLFATHAAYILSEVNGAIGKSGEKFTIEPSKEAEEAWSMQILMGAAAFASMSGCTPSYINREGEFDRQTSMEEQMKSARASPWTQGALDYARVIEAWRKEGGLKGLEVAI